MERMVQLVLAGLAGGFCTAALIFGGIAVTDRSTLDRTENNSKIACQRTREFAPYQATFDRTHNVMPAAVLAKYESTIPREC